MMTRGLIVSGILSAALLAVVLAAQSVRSSVGPVHAAGACVPPPEGLISWWRNNRNSTSFYAWRTDRKCTSLPYGLQYSFVCHLVGMAFQPLKAVVRLTGCWSSSLPRLPVR